MRNGGRTNPPHNACNQIVCAPPPSQEQCENRISKRGMDATTKKSAGARYRHRNRHRHRHLCWRPKASSGHRHPPLHRYASLQPSPQSSSQVPAVRRARQALPERRAPTEQPVRRVPPERWALRTRWALLKPVYWGLRERRVLRAWQALRARQKQPQQLLPQTHLQRRSQTQPHPHPHSHSHQYQKWRTQRKRQVQAQVQLQAAPWDAKRRE